MTEKLSADELRKHKGISFTGVTTCFYCHDGNGLFFLAKRSMNSRDEQEAWDVGGGGLKWGSSAEDNVRREVIEEYGATIQSIDFLGYRDVFRQTVDGTRTHWLALDFLVLVDKDTVLIRESDNFTDSGWFKLTHLPAPLHSQLPAALKKYKARLFDI